MKCGVSKPETEYYSYRWNTDGLQKKCKVCILQYSKERVAKKRKDPVWLNNYRELTRECARKYRAKTDIPYDKDRVMAVIRAAKIKYPEKFKARAETNKAIRKGILVREPCFCGKKAEAHHPDYSDPLRVMWLCRQHHHEEHVRVRREALLNSVKNE